MPFLFFKAIAPSVFSRPSLRPYFQGHPSISGLALLTTIRAAAKLRPIDKDAKGSDANITGAAGGPWQARRLLWRLLMGCCLWAVAYGLLRCYG